MIVKNWDVWHCYSSFISASKVDLSRASRDLVEAGFAICSVHRDGETWWSQDERIFSGLTQIEVNSRGDRSSYKLIADGADGITGYAAEVWSQACKFRFSELRLLGESEMVPAYIRLALGEFHLTSRSSGFSAVVYPVVKVFESGVLLVQFRVMSPERDMDSDEFIGRFINLAGVSFDKVEVPPSISSLATRAYSQHVAHWPFYHRPEILYRQYMHDKHVRINSRQIESGDFVAEISRLSSSAGGDTLSSLARTIFNMVAFVLSKPRYGLPYLLLGQVKLLETGNWWSGRPHIYLLDYEGQEDSASRNLEKFSAEFGWMLGRVPRGDDKSGRRYLSEDYRHFDDYSLFISSSATLLAWSRSGKADTEFADPNNGHLIYEHHAVVEHLEYGCILHRALLHKAENGFSLEQIHSARHALNKHQASMIDSSYFGEIRELLSAGWNVMGTPELQERIKESLAVKESEVALLDSRQNEKINRRLTVLFGIIATPPLAGEVLKPLWTWKEWAIPSNENLATLMFISIAFFVVVFATWLLSLSKR